MTISMFCREQLREHGPLSLDVLTERAVAAGKTKSQNPAATVKAVLGTTEVLLPDGRWATPMWLLEGRCLTTRTIDGWSFAEHRDEEWEGRDQHDLDLLHFAVKGGPIPLATGGVLRQQGYYSLWRAPKGWPFLHASRGELLGLRIVEGVLHVEVVARTPELIRRGRELAGALGPLDAGRRYWGNELMDVKDILAKALWARMAHEPAFLRTPVPPLSECIPRLEVAVRRYLEVQRERELQWPVHLVLPSALKWIADEESTRSDQRPEEWLNDFVTRSLRDLAGEDAYGDVLQFGGRVT